MIQRPMMTDHQSSFNENSLQAARVWLTDGTTMDGRSAGVSFHEGYRIGCHLESVNIPSRVKNCLLMREAKWGCCCIPLQSVLPAPRCSVIAPRPSRAKRSDRWDGGACRPA